MRFNTPIEVTENTGSTPEEARRCGSKLLVGGSTIVKTLSSTDTIDCEEVLKEAQEIKRRAQQNQPNVVSGKRAVCLLLICLT